jgi:hypothetical protein
MFRCSQPHSDFCHGTELTAYVIVTIVYIVYYFHIDPVK